MRKLLIATALFVITLTISTTADATVFRRQRVVVHRNNVVFVQPFTNFVAAPFYAPPVVPLQFYGSPNVAPVNYGYQQRLRINTGYYNLNGCNLNGFGF